MKRKNAEKFPFEELREILDLTWDQLADLCTQSPLKTDHIRLILKGASGSILKVISGPTSAPSVQDMRNWQRRGNKPGRAVEISMLTARLGIINEHGNLLSRLDRSPFSKKSCLAWLDEISRKADYYGGLSSIREPKPSADKKRGRFDLLNPDFDHATEYVSIPVRYSTGEVMPAGNLMEDEYLIEHLATHEDFPR